MIGLAAGSSPSRPRRPGLSVVPLPGWRRRADPAATALAILARLSSDHVLGSVTPFNFWQVNFRLFPGAPFVFKGQHCVTLALAFRCSAIAATADRAASLLRVLAIAFVLSSSHPIGGATSGGGSMLNSYSGWAAAGIGFSLNNSMLIIAGSLVGSSGAILSYIMCRAMNRSFFNVILGGFGGEAGGPAVGKAEQRPVKSGSADDAAFVLGNAETVVIVPGYGLAVARAQHAVKELATKLIEKGITVKYAIHPVAGRMPGHMNVLLAEADVPYEQLREMDDINPEFGRTDVSLVIGANDVGTDRA